MCHEWKEAFKVRKKYEYLRKRISSSYTCFRDTSNFIYSGYLESPSKVHLSNIMNETFLFGLSNMQWYVMVDNYFLSNKNNLIWALSI